MSGIVECAVETVRPLIEQRRHELTVSSAAATDLAGRRRRPAGTGGREPAHQRREIHRRRRSHLAEPSNKRAMSACCKCGIRASASPPNSCPASSTCSRRRNGPWPARKAGWASGCALVQRLVEMHGGKVAGLQCFGARQRVRRASAGGADCPHRSRHRLPPKSAKPTGPSLRVLVVDDNVDTAESLAMLLQEVRA